MFFFAVISGRGSWHTGQESTSRGNVDTNSDNNNNNNNNYEEDDYEEGYEDEEEEHYSYEKHHVTQSVTHRPTPTPTQPSRVHEVSGDRVHVYENDDLGFKTTQDINKLLAGLSKEAGKFKHQVTLRGNKPVVQVFYLLV